MIYYIAPILIGFVLSFYENRYNNTIIHKKTFKNIYVLLCALIFCGGYMTGSDWQNYELMYNNILSFHLNQFTREHGFYLLMFFFKKVGFGFFPFLIICKFFVFYVIKQFISQYSINFYLSFSMFLASDALFIFVDNPLRFMLAIGFVTISFKYLLNRSFLPYLILILIAASFHISSIIMLLIYFVPQIKLINKSVSIIIYLSIFLLLTAPVLGELIEKYAIPYLLFIDINYYLERSTQVDIQYFSIGRIINVLFFILIVLNREVICNYGKYGELYYKLTIAYFYLILFSLMPTFFRLSLFLAPFLYISLSLLLLTVSYKKILQIFIISYFIFSPIKDVYTSWVYIPYSNYFISLFQTEQSYYYRSNYNKIKYYQRTGKWPE